MAQNNSTLNIAQWDCRGLRNESHMIPNISSNNDILLLSETWLIEDINYGIAKMNLTRKDREDRVGGGVAIALKKGLLFEEITLDTPIFVEEHFEVIATKVTLQNKNLLAVSIYNPPNYKRSLASWRSLLKELLIISRDDPIIIAGDLNARTLGQHENARIWHKPSRSNRSRSSRT